MTVVAVATVSWVYAVYDAAGNNLSGTSSMVLNGCNDTRVVVPDDDVYELVVEARSDSDDTGTYQIQLTAV